MRGVLCGCYEVKDIEVICKYMDILGVRLCDG